MKKLYIIFTRVDELTQKYFKLFKDNCSKKSPKGIALNTFHDDIGKVQYLEYDYIIIPEDFYRDFDQTLLKKIIEENSKVFLTLHKGSKKREDHETFIQKLAGEKLQLPVRLEIHSEGGPTFDYLCNLGAYYKSKKRYNKVENQFEKLFAFDLKMEAKIALLDHCQYPNRIKYYLNGNGHSWPNPLHKEIHDLVKQPKIIQVVEAILQGKEDNNISAIKKLNCLLFCNN